jgi:predicted MPP superfamily phosphohydrolase
VGEHRALPRHTGADKRRIFRVKGSTLFITCGVGYGFIPVRFGSPPRWRW